MADEKTGFTSLTSLRKGPPDPDAALADIRRIYFRTTKQTIQHDLAHAIELIKSLPTEEQRERAAVYMDGLAQMRSEWAGGNSGSSGKGGRSRKGSRK